ncbi:ferrichrome ABC transporter substrate-binding protein [Lentibacillus populi]|uniref:Ferrichrome ABC transporter substrate-binding protein n=1 Tax=Lentibacillus populi TaxID=1827502 RepID=A0A9W5X5E3_9BACI|nr:MULTISPECIES: ABC transporter substrate-binding protein [Bacillaceae]MBT2215372.1 ABC transporter substrate-binding protein [Virgibacillus dakarensis]GGB39671.1 ferrichrome ABC transporter substrate-binding protein [Lentibacillus populi]
MKRIPSRLTIFALLVVLSMIIAACGNSADDKQTNESKTESEGNTEVTLDSKMGEVTLPADIKNVIAPYHEDALLALGITPVAKWSIGESIQNYLEDELKDVPRIEWNLPVEQVLEKSPDLIILESNLDSYEGSYEDYQKIAPTYVMPEEVTTDWKKQIETFGKIFQKQDKATDVLNQYKDKVQDAKAKLTDAIGDQTVAAIMVMGDKFYLFEKDRHVADVLYSDLGLQVPALVDSLGNAKAQWNPISIEKLSELKADHVFLLAEEGEQGMETLQNSQVWQNTPAAKNDHVYTLNDPSHWTNKGLIASEKTIDDVLKELVK